MKLRQRLDRSKLLSKNTVQLAMQLDMVKAPVAEGGRREEPHVPDGVVVSPFEETQAGNRRGRARGVGGVCARVCVQFSLLHEVGFTPILLIMGGGTEARMPPGPAVSEQWNLNVRAFPLSAPHSLPSTSVCPSWRPCPNSQANPPQSAPFPAADTVPRCWEGL